MRNRLPKSYVREAEVTYRRRAFSPLDGARPFTDSSGVASMLHKVIGARITESVVVLALDARNRPIGFHEVSRGGVSDCSLAVADVLRYPLLVGACSIIIAHNHPSGDPNPSGPDITITERIKRGCDLMGIALLDHVIVAESDAFSFLDHGLMGRIAEAS